MGNVIHATILKGKFKGEEVLIPRIPMIPTDMPFEFKRIQFPIVCGLNLENKCFYHGHVRSMFTCRQTIRFVRSCT
jgi:ATP-dependent DNA helicase PIF1